MTQQSWLLLSAFSPPFFFRFSCLIFFSLAGHLVGFILVGRVFRKAFRILGLGERKGRWVMEQDFHGDFQVLVTWFFASFSGVLDWIVLILVWFERSLHPAQVSEKSCPWPLKLMTSQRVERTWIRTGGYWRFRGEWVKGTFQNFFMMDKLIFVGQLMAWILEHQWLSFLRLTFYQVDFISVVTLLFVVTKNCGAVSNQIINTLIIIMIIVHIDCLCWWHLAFN